MKDSQLWLYDYERCAMGAAGGVVAAGEEAAVGRVAAEGGQTAAGSGVAAKKEMATAGDTVGAREGFAGAGLRRYGVLGIDEAGRGSLAGPVVAAAAYLLPQAYEDARLRDTCHLIDDSKKLNRAQRDTLFAQLANWRAVGLLRIAAGEASVAEIEAHNIVGATALAMRRAVAALELPFELPAGECVKVGGKRASPQRTAQASASVQPELFAAESVKLIRRASVATLDTAALPPQVSIAPCRKHPKEHHPNAALPPHVWVDGLPMPKRLPWAHAGIISGDAASLAIAMASIWAKVSRDRLLGQLATEFPYYGWETNAGYGTASHKQALSAHGACHHHRPKFLRKLGLHGSRK